MAVDLYYLPNIEMVLISLINKDFYNIPNTLLSLNNQALQNFQLQYFRH